MLCMPCGNFNSFFVLSESMAFQPKKSLWNEIHTKEILLLINKQICHRTVFPPSITFFPNDSVIRNRFTCIRNHKFETSDSGIVWCLIFSISRAFLYQLETYAHFKISTDSLRIVLDFRWFLSLMPFLILRKTFWALC